MELSARGMGTGNRGTSLAWAEGESAQGNWHFRTYMRNPGPQ